MCRTELRKGFSNLFQTTQDAALTAHVPKVRGTMETLVYRVKGMLALNNIESAWHMGNLRNRDVHNVELSTQVTSGFSLYCIFFVLILRLTDSLLILN